MVKSINLKRIFMLAWPAIIPIEPDMSLLIQLGRKSQWGLFCYEFLLFAVVEASVLYLALARDNVDVSDSQTEHRRGLWYPDAKIGIGIIALVTVNVFAHRITQSLLNGGFYR
jgi:hypothetical protein